MEIQDERTPEQMQTHTVLVVGTDSSLSGWGRAKGGFSYAAWACTPEQASETFRRVSSRGDMKRVRYASDPYRPKGRGHLHIYVERDEQKNRPTCDDPGAHGPGCRCDGGEPVL